LKKILCNTLVIGETEQEKAAREKKEKSKKIIIWSAVGVGVIVIGIIAYRMYSKKK
jgi:flagellar basal body-associated protein FliL